MMRRRRRRTTTTTTTGAAAAAVTGKPPGVFAFSCPGQRSPGRRCNVADADKPGTGFGPGKVDEDQHGWAPDAPGDGEAKERVLEGGKKAWEAHDTQEAARGDGGQDRDLTPDGVGESQGRRGENMVDEEGKEPGRYDSGTQGKSSLPVGGSTARDSTGVSPQEPITGDQGG